MLTNYKKIVKFVQIAASTGLRRKFAEFIEISSFGESARNDISELH